MPVVIILQARMGSSRLPGKVLKPVQGRPLLAYMVERLQRCHLTQGLIVATSTDPQDEAIAQWCASAGIACFRGSQDDVLDRYYQAARSYTGFTHAMAVVRVTGDCPVIDPQVVDRVIEDYLQHADRCDYVSNTIERTYPDGMDTEVFSFALLERAWREATQPHEREHVTPYMRLNPNVRIRQVCAERDDSRWRLTVDYEDDFALIEQLLTGLYPAKPTFSLEDIRMWFQEHPGMSSLNQAHIPEVYKARRLKQSYALWEKALALTPGASQTMSKRPNLLPDGFSPKVLQSGQGAYAFDVDGNRYTDYSMGLCALVLGYQDPDVDAAIRQQLKQGISFSLPHRLEGDLAEQLVEIIPCAEQVRFAKNGSDATSGAIRLARAYTGREHIAVCGYHGAQDWYVGTLPLNRGVPEAVKGLTHSFSYNQIETLEALFAQWPRSIAAVILEAVNVTPPQPGFLEAVIACAHKHGALVIFDEIVTGFRLRLGGAQEFFGVRPDLACFGKALANGLPLSAIVGPRTLMQGFNELFFSHTAGGETLSLAAALAVIEKFRRVHVIQHLWEQGNRLKSGLEQSLATHQLQPYIKVVGYGPRHLLKFSDARGQEWAELRTLFLQEAMKRGILTLGAHNMAYAHTLEVVNETLGQYASVFRLLGQAVRDGNLRDYLQAPVAATSIRPVN